MKNKKIWKWLFIFLSIIIFPIIILIIILFWDNGHLLTKFNDWINTPGNLGTFISICSMYIPLVASIINIILLVKRLCIYTQEKKRFLKKPTTKTIYDDTNKSVYFDTETKKITIDYTNPHKEQNLKQTFKTLVVDVEEIIKQFERVNGSDL